MLAVGSAGRGTAAGLQGLQHGVHIGLGQVLVDRLGQPRAYGITAKVRKDGTATPQSSQSMCTTCLAMRNPTTTMAGATASNGTTRRGAGTPLADESVADESVEDESVEDEAVAGLVRAVAARDQVADRPRAVGRAARQPDRPGLAAGL